MFFECKLRVDVYWLALFRMMDLVEYSGGGFFEMACVVQGVCLSCVEWKGFQCYVMNMFLYFFCFKVGQQGIKIGF